MRQYAPTGTFAVLSQLAVRLAGHAMSESVKTSEAAHQGAA